MASIDIPKIRVSVDWNGDGWINKGVVASTPRNLVVNPLTLYNQILYTNIEPYYLNPKYDPTDRGLYSYGAYNVNVNPLTVGRNKGSTGSYDAFFIPTQTGTYTLQFYLKRTGAHNNMTLQVQNVYPNPTNTTNITQTPLNITSTSTSYQLITYTFTVTNITNMVIGVQLWCPSSSMQITITGFQVMLGTFSTAQVWNTNDPYMLYDDISAYVESANGQLGMSGTFDNIAAEGSLSLVLRNTTKIFSPENSSSPFYSFDSSADPNFPAGRYPYTFPALNWANGCIISVDIQDPVLLTYTEMWRGFIDTVDAGTGQSDPTATLTALQGIFKLENYLVDVSGFVTYSQKQGVGDSVFGRGQVINVSNQTASTIIKVILNSAFQSALMPNVASLNRTNGDNSKFFDILSPIAYNVDADDGRTFNAYSAWSGNTNAIQALKDICVVDQGLFFILRNGQARYINRDSIYTNGPSAPADVVIDDLLVNADDYNIDQGTANAVKVEYFPTGSASGAIWTSKSPLFVPAKSTKTFTAKLELPEGSKITALSYNGFTAAVSPSTAVAKNSAGVTFAKQNFLINVSLKGAEAYLTIQNLASVDYYIAVVLNGTYNITYGSSSYYSEKVDGFSTLGIKYQNVSSKLLTSEDQARGLATHLLGLLAYRYASFSSISISSRDNIWTQRILNNTVGTRIKFREVNTGNIYHRMMIIGENWTWTPGILQMTWKVRPADNYPFLNTDTSFYKLGGVVY